MNENDELDPQNIETEEKPVINENDELDPQNIETEEKPD